MRSDALALYPKITKLHKQVWLAGGQTHRFYSSTWFVEAFPSISHWIQDLQKAFNLLKKNNVAWRRYKKLPWDSAKFAWKGDRLATDATLFEESCALSLSKGKRGLGPLWMKKILPGNSGGIHGGVYAIVLVVSLGSEKCLSQTTDCSDCPESQGLVYVQNVDTVLNRRRWRHHWSTCGFSTQRNPGKIPQHSFWWNEWTEPNLICIEAGGFHY